MTYLERQMVQKMIEEYQNKKRKKSNFEIALWVSALPIMALVVALIAWSCTWGWTWYGYLAFYSGITLIWPCLAFYMVVLEEIK